MRQTRSIFLAAIACCLITGSSFGSLMLDEIKILKSAEKALSLPPHWKLRLTGVQPSIFPGLLEANLEVQVDNQIRNQKIFISTDSTAYIVGNSYQTSADMDAERRKMVNLKGAPSKGPADAPVTVVEFSDLQCSACKKAHDALINEKPLESFGNRVRFVYKHFPLPNHAWARPAAIATECARQQKPDAFWSMQHEIFSLQSAITPDSFRDMAVGIAGKLGLKQKPFEACLDGPSAAARVAADVQEGNAIGVSSTPSFMINGRLIGGSPGSANLKLMVETFLNAGGDAP